ncbi:MAG: aminodeoxychorismate/anthranilate synthase component II [Actinomycetota bacterium]|nr:aminodeoxychorismate/anthranilate synthase component II [Actinomycetota bacterium]
MRVVLIDNYDSFVYNLAQYVGASGATPVVLRNDSSLEEVEAEGPDAIIVSPGPGRPEDTGCCIEVIKKIGPRVPLLGVCLGHQAIGVAFGATVGRATKIMHGKTSLIDHDGAGVFEGLPQPFEATRYHSLVIEPTTIKDPLIVSATTHDGVVMGVRHRTNPIHGVQFHPESILTTSGMQLIKNFLSSI